MTSSQVSPSASLMRSPVWARNVKNDWPLMAKAAEARNAEDQPHYGHLALVLVPTPDSLDALAYVGALKQVPDIDMHYVIEALNEQEAHTADLLHNAVCASKQIATALGLEYEPVRYEGEDVDDMEDLDPA
jgi:hypothetical protein